MAHDLLLTKKPAHDLLLNAQLADNKLMYCVNVQREAAQQNEYRLPQVWSLLKVNRIICDGVRDRNDFGILKSVTLTLNFSTSEM